MKLIQLMVFIVFLIGYSTILAATPQELKDSAINQAVTQNIQNKNVMAGSTVVASTKNGYVKLYGHVNTQEQANKIIGAAREVDGVQGVDASALNIFTGENDTNGVPYNNIPR